MGTGKSGIRAATAHSIEIDFYYQGARCRERLKLAPTAANLKYAANLKARIENEITLGTFDYATHFPNSKRSAQLSKQPGAALTIGKSLEAWLAGKKGSIEHTTFHDYELAIANVWWPAFGEKRLTELSRSDLREWVGKQTCGLKRIRNLLLPLRGMYEQAFEDEVITSNPFIGFTPRKVEPPKEDDDIDPFTPAEVKAILAECSGQIRNLFQFVFWTGLRTSEVIALQWGDVDFINSTITVRRAKVRKQVKAPKTKSGRRTIALLPPALEAIKAQKAHSFLAGNEVFLNPRTGEPWEHDGPIRKTAWHPALKSAGVRYRYPYQMRHTFASTMLSAGENPMWVAAVMGHKDWTMIAKVYGRWIPSTDPNAGMKASAIWSVFGQATAAKP